MKNSIMLFAGTSEGRELCHFLMRHGFPAIVYTATEYGAEILRQDGIVESDILRIKSGRLDKEAMLKEMLRLKPYAVVDATHPYAVDASSNIKQCCQQAGITMYRVLRRFDDPPATAGIKRFHSISEAAEALKGRDGKVFLTIGVKGLKDFCDAFGSQELDRVCVRVMPVAESVIACERCGISRKNILAAEGPFDLEMNKACIRHFGISFLVTKETGKEGGFREKLQAAEDCGIEMITIMRPLEESGYDLAEVKKMILRSLSLPESEAGGSKETPV